MLKKNFSCIKNNVACSELCLNCFSGNSCKNKPELQPNDDIDIYNDIFGNDENTHDFEVKSESNRSELNGRKNFNDKVTESCESEWDDDNDVKFSEDAYNSDTESETSESDDEPPSKKARQKNK